VQKTQEINAWLYLPGLFVLGFGILAILSSKLSLGRIINSSVYSKSFVIHGTQLILAILIICSLVAQYRYLKLRHPKIVRMELWLAVAISIVPAAALVIGDLSGASAFNNAAELSIAGILVVLVFSCVIASALINTGNALLIVCRESKFVRIFGAIAYCVTWLILAGVTYVVYTLTYSVHDPNSE